MTSKDHSFATNKEVATILLAGGEGKRLQPLTNVRCKPAMSFAGRYRIVDVAMSNAIHSGFTDIYVLTQFLATSLNNYLIETYSKDAFSKVNLQLLSPEETPTSKVWYKGTADAVRQNIKTLMNHPAEYFVILSGDQLYSMDLNEMLQFAKKTDADLVIATIPVEEEEAKRMGVMKINSDFEIIDFFEKPQNKKTIMKFAIAPDIAKKHDALHDLSFLGSMGIYIFKRSALINLLYNDPREDFGKHLIPTQMKKGKTFAYIFSGYWEDIGTIKSYYTANLKLTQKNQGLDLYNEAHPILSKKVNLPSAKITGNLISNTIICDGSIIEAKEVSNSMLGMKTFVGEGTTIKDSVVVGWSPYSNRSPIRIGKNCMITKAIIDEGSQIGDNVHLTNTQNLQEFDDDLIAIRDGIIIIKANSHIPDNYKV